MEKISFYICSWVENKKEVRQYIKKLTKKEWICTYDWTQNKDDVSSEAWPHIAKLEIMSVCGADVVIVILPAKLGSHSELGAAIANAMSRKSLHLNKLIYVLSEDGEILDLTKKQCMFYHHPAVKCIVGPIKNSIENIIKEAEAIFYVN